jgi:hypothetical protein
VKEVGYKKYPNGYFLYPRGKVTSARGANQL